MDTPSHDILGTTKLKYRNITVSGGIATGTSTLARKLSETLEWKRINAGDIQREYDRERGMSEHFSGSDTRSDEHERAIEAMTQQKLTRESNLVYEAWLSGFVARDIKDVLKVLLVCDDALRIDRVVNRDKMTVAEAKKQIESREQGNLKKWKEIYGDFNFWNPKYYDLVIDTYSSGPNETVGKVLDKLGYISSKKSLMKRIIPVALGLLINDQGQFLITLRNDPKNKWAHLKWEIPGGGVEKGETPEQAVVRELKEEVGVETSLLNYPPVVTKMRRQIKSGELVFIFSTFLCKIERGTIVLDRREAIDYRWATLPELKALPYLSKTDEIVEEAMKLLNTKM